MLLNDISDKKLRNVIRGLLGAENETVLYNTLAHLKKIKSPEKTHAVWDFLHNSPLAKNFPHTDPFPIKPQRSTSGYLFEDNHLESELVTQLVRIKKHDDKCAKLLVDLTELDKKLVLGEQASDLVEHFNQILSEYGHSIALLKRVISTKYLIDSSDLFDRFFQSVIYDYNRPRKDIVAIGIDDSFDTSIGYISVRQQFLRYLNSGQITGSNALLIQDHFSPFGHDGKHYANVLQSYGLVSLTDTLLYIIRMKDFFSHDLSPSTALKLDKQLEDIGVTDWLQAHEVLSVDFFDLEDEQSTALLEYRALKQSSAWLDWSNIFEHRRWVESQISSRLDGLPETKVISETGKVSWPRTFSLDAIVKNPFQKPKTFGEIDPSSDGSLHRTVALLDLLKRDNNAESLNGDELLQLLDKTVDVSLLANPEELKSFFCGNLNDKLYQYLKAALVFDAENNTVTSHKFRKCTQKLILSDHQGDIVQFAKFLDGQAAHVCNHFIDACSETFLVQLYDLFPTADDVVEANASLMEWRAERFNEPFLDDRAKALRLDLKLNQVRSDFDDSRIYVDPLRFAQWLQDNLSGDIRTLVSVVSEKTQKAPTSSDFANPVSIIEDERLLLGSILQKAYTEFCTNSFYGVDSYIGRRIRHGTLNGVMCTEVRTITSRASQELCGTNLQAAQVIEDWYASYAAEIERIGADVLQLKDSSKNRAMIDPAISSPNKSLAVERALTEISKFLQKDDALPNTLGLIQEFCWIILEADLREIRKELENLRAQKLFIDPSKLKIAAIGAERRKIVDICRELNDCTNRKFLTLINWLTKPNTVSPSAELELLFKAVMHEVAEQYESFEPSLEVNAELIDLYGHRYHCIYDILEVFVANAAKHGAANGVLGFSAHLERLEGENKAVCHFKISSHALSHSALKHQRAQIEQRMNEDIEDAHRIEGNSGIKKVRSLISSYDELSNLSVHFDELEIAFRFQLELALS